MSNETTKPKPEDMQIVLEAILAKLQEIDETAASRGAHASGIIFGQMHGLDKAVFEDEICLIKKALGLPQNAPPPPVIIEQATEPRFSMDL